MRSRILVLFLVLFGFSQTVQGDPQGEILYAIRVNPKDRKILVWSMESAIGGNLKINSIRDYTYELILDELDVQKGGNAWTTSEVRDWIQKNHPEFKKEKEAFLKANKGKKFDAEDWVKGGSSPLKPSESVSLFAFNGVSSWNGPKDPALCASISNTGFFYLLDEANKKIVAYQIVLGGTLRLVSVRKWDYDERYEPWDPKLKMTTSEDFPKFIGFTEFKKEVEKQEKKRKEQEEKDNK